MKKIIISCFIFLISLNALDLDKLDLNNFDDRQIALNYIKELILKEEQIARVYEEYILENYAKPSTPSSTILSYGLSKELKADLQIKSLYESNTYRQRTFLVDEKIHFIVEDDFAKHILQLILKQNSSINDCSSTTKTKYCKKGDILEIYESISHTSLLFTYHKDKFKTGPIIITNEKAKYVSDEFDFISKGAILYNVNGIKYIKTLNSIKKLQ